MMIIQLKMNSNQAKKLQIVDYLSRIGIEKINQKGNEYWYSSPFRTDTKPSFKVDIIQNIWFDFGEGKGGNILDLVMNLNNCNIKEALSILNNSNFTYNSPPAKNSFSFHQQNITKLIIKELEHKALFEYIEKRALKMPYIKLYCKDANYMLNNKYYFAIAFKNDKNGYELRNKYIKINIIKKEITTIINSNNDNINVFEGFFDFISYLQISNNGINENHIILNSTALAKHCIDKLKTFKKVYYYLDNDEAGKKITELLIKEIPNSENKSNSYINYKDLNELLMKEKKEIYV